MTGPYQTGKCPKCGGPMFSISDKPEPIGRGNICQNCKDKVSQAKQCPSCARKMLKLTDEGWKCEYCGALYSENYFSVNDKFGNKQQWSK